MNLAGLPGPRLGPQKALGAALHAPSNQPSSDGVQPRSNGVQPKSDGLQPTSDGLQPTSDGLLTRMLHASSLSGIFLRCSPLRSLPSA